MAISKRRITLMAISLFALVGLSQIVAESIVEARAGGGGSGGFRGSRTYSAPARPAQPTRPSEAEETPFHRHNNLASLRRKVAALCVPLARPCWAGFWAPCSSQD